MKKILAFTVIALAGCKTQISADLYTSDLVAVAEGEKMTAPLVIGFEAPSKTECTASGEAVLAAVRTVHSTAEFIGCEDAGFDTFARFRVQAEIVTVANTPPIPTEAFAVSVRPLPDSVHVSYLVNMVAARAIWEALPDDMTEYRTYQFEPELAAVLTNDLRSPAEVTVDDVFSDGEPIQGTKSIVLERRGQVELKMSNVTNSAFGNTSYTSSILSFSTKRD